MRGEMCRILELAELLLLRLEHKALILQYFTVL